jgi:uncharacterized protein YggE
MKRFGRAVPVALAAALLLSACAGAAGASQTRPPRSIIVTGTGTARLAPDVVIITLGVQTHGPDIAEAVSENNRGAERVRQAVREAGVADEDVQTANYSVWSQQSYDEFGNITEGEPTYWVDNSIVIKLREIGRLGELLETALSRGANSVQGVTYSVDDPSEALDAARVQALEDARSQAAQMAADAGVLLGDVIAIGGPSAYPGPVMEAPAFGKGGGGGVPTSPGVLEYDVQVTVTYAIR